MPRSVAEQPPQEDGDEGDGDDGRACEDDEGSVGEDGAEAALAGVEPGCNGRSDQKAGHCDRRCDESQHGCEAGEVVVEVGRASADRELTLLQAWARAAAFRRRGSGSLGGELLERCASELGELGRVGAGNERGGDRFSLGDCLHAERELGVEPVTGVDRILQGYDANNRVFVDERALMQAVQADIDLGAAPFQAALPVNQQTVLMLPDFRRMAGDYHLPGEVQQTLALNILADTHELERVYAQLARRVTAGVESSESVMKWFTGETRAFAVRVIQEGMVTLAHPPTAPFSMAMAGSGAREEMFPGSDLDLAPVTDVVDQHGVAALFEFVQYVEKRLKATMDYLKVKLGLPHELGLGPDTGVFGFARTAELLAKKVVEMQNTGQDATEIYGSQGSAELTTRFERERDTQGTPKHALEQLHGLLVEPRRVTPSLRWLQT